MAGCKIDGCIHAFILMSEFIILFGEILKRRCCLIFIIGNCHFVNHEELQSKKTFKWAIKNPNSLSTDISKKFCCKH